MVFDDQVLNYPSGHILGLPIVNAGWGPRKVFVVNSGTQPAGFTAVYIGAKILELSLILGSVIYVTLI